MTEAIEKTFEAGYRTWRKNKILGAPFLIEGIINLVFCFILAGISVGVLIFGVVTENAVMASVLLFALSAISMLLMLLVSSFFKSAAIGMCREATEGRKADLGSMFSLGKKKALQIFTADILLLLFGAAMFMLFFSPMAITAFSRSFSMSVSLLFIGLSFISALSAIMRIIFSPMHYAIVLSDTGALEGIKKAYHFIMQNKTATLLLIFAIEGVGWGFGQVQELITNIFNVIPLIGPLISLVVLLAYAVFFTAVLVPMFALWWTRLYMGRTGMEPKETFEQLTEKVPGPTPQTPIQGPVYV